MIKKYEYDDTDPYSSAINIILDVAALASESGAINNTEAKYLRDVARTVIENDPQVAVSK